MVETMFAGYGAPVLVLLGLYLVLSVGKRQRRRYGGFAQALGHSLRRAWLFPAGLGLVAVLAWSTFILHKFEFHHEVEGRIIGGRNWFQGTASGTELTLSSAGVTREVELPSIPQDLCRTGAMLHRDAWSWDLRCGDAVEDVTPRFDLYLGSALLLLLLLGIELRFR